MLKILAQMNLFSTSVLNENFMDAIVLRVSFACLCLQMETRNRGLFVHIRPIKSGYPGQRNRQFSCIALPPAKT